MGLQDLTPHMTPPPLLPLSFPLGRAWFVVFVSSNEMRWSKDKHGNWDFPVVRRIEEEGFETFVPVEQRTIVRRGRKQVQTVPLFGSYVFVRFDREADDWGILNGDDIEGVHFIIQDTFNIPIRVPDKEIDRLRRAELAGAFDLTKPCSIFQEGDDVEIREGPFAGLIAKVRSAHPHKRVKLLLEGLGRLEIEAGCLTKVG